ncbi:MAG: glycosyltransferase [Chloroflexi bacterium]|nr:glycosyltransferase [Chloroflexota bacterium]
MRFLIVDSYYQSFLEDFYAQHPDVLGWPYEEQRRALMAQAFGSADFYSRALLALGHEAEEVVADDDRLQLKWAAERGLRVRSGRDLLSRAARRLLRQNWRCDVVRAQVQAFRPDVVYVQEMNLLPDALLAELKQRGRLLVAQVATRIPAERTFAAYDLVVSSLPNLVASFRGRGLRAEYLPLGFGAGGLEDVAADGEPVAVSHVGGYGPIHAERNVLLEYVAQRIPVDFWGYGTENLAPDSPILGCYHGQAWGLEMYRVRRRSRLVLTRHITSVAGPYANNCTLFEATGVGACLVVDRKDNLAQLFALDAEVVTYASPDECVEKLRYLLEHEAERKAIAEAGQQRTLRCHTYRQRMQELLDILRRYLP